MAVNHRIAVSFEDKEYREFIRTSNEQDKSSFWIVKQATVFHLEAQNYPQEEPNQKEWN